MKKTNSIFHAGLLAFLFLLSLHLHAGTSNYTSLLKGTQISNAATIALQDDEMSFMLNNPGTWPATFTNYGVVNRVRLKYLDALRNFYSASWTVDVPVEIKTYDETGSLLATETATLQIGYDPAANTSYTAESVYQATIPGYRTVVRITGAPTLSGIASLPDDIILESEIETERYFEFDITTVPTISNTVDGSNGKVTFYWQYLPGAEHYDLEFLYVSAYDAAALASPDMNDATRVNLSQQNYTVNTIFDDGRLYYRVRGVGRHGSDFTDLKPGAFSTAAYVTVTNPYADRNWTYSAGYAEDGLRKEGFMLYDGSGRQRQAVTLQNSDNVALIAETFYDYEGRGVISTMSAPDANFTGNLKFYTQFSLNAIGSPVMYSRTDFDHDGLFVGGDCAMGTPRGMSKTSGASRYYSDQNGRKTIAFNGAIPDAQTFPFSQVVFDREGRVKKQSGVGDDHKIKSVNGHETEYFYATASQDKLDRLFGNEVGYAEHYSLKASKDANGQLSLAYLDLSGRVIASALAGEAPANLDALDSNAPTNFTEHFDYLNHYDAGQQAWIVNSNFLVTNPGTDYDFTYELTPEEYSSMCASVNGDCKYLLIIDIYDNCNNILQNTGGSPIIHEVQQLNPYNLTTTFTVVFPKVGTYRIEKRLTLDPDAMQVALDAFKAGLPGSCITSQEELGSQYNVPENDCNDCENYCEQLADAEELTGEPREEFIAACLEDTCGLNADSLEVNCDVLLDVLKDDMSPGGQYFDASGWMLAYVSTNPGFSWGGFNTWLNAGGNGCANVGSYSFGNWTDVNDEWEDCFAAYLVQFHPEYCHYDWCVLTETSQQFDIGLFEGDYAWATTHPSGTPYIVTGQTPVGLNLRKADPYYSTAGIPAGDSLLMYNTSMNTGFLTDNDGSGTDMWAQAGTLAGCTACDQQWLIFRNLYLARKSEIMRDTRNGTFACYALHDADNPPDNIADGPTCTPPTPPYPNCNPVEVLGFIIRVPDYGTQLADIDTQAEAINWGDSLALVYDICKTAATSSCTVDIFGAAEYDFGSTCSTPVTIDVCSIEITGGVCPTGVLTEAQLALLIANAINIYTSIPDYTASIDPSDDTKVLIYGPAYLGSAGNCAVTVTIPGGLSSYLDLTVPTFSGGSDSGPCPDALHCFCAVLDQLNDLYAAQDPGNGNAYYIDHTTYTTANSYIIYALAQRYGYTATGTQITDWLSNCDTDMGDPTGGGVTALPAELDCENPPVDCDEDQPEIQGFNASWMYDQAYENAIDSFLVEYVRQCFGGDFKEEFSVTYTETEHHYTLYYYDQAGSLTRTVPPAGVHVLNSTDVGNVQTYRNTGGSPVYPDHSRSTNNLVTNYKYNTLNQLVEQSTPDGGTTVFYYDKVGRIVASQDARLAALSTGGIYLYAYTLYDAQGRPNESGLVTKSSALNAAIASDYATFVTFITTSSTRNEVTSTYYDVALNGTVSGSFSSGNQDNLRKRVATVTYETSFDNDPDVYESASHYSYDIHGNVFELLQENTTLADMGQHLKRLQYGYDLISGKVNTVKYQAGEADQFYHRYDYDADGRLTNTWTSNDEVIWEQDAKYYYYLHGPLARTETGHEKVQGTDYAYTIQGWIKGVNSNILDETKDLGKDGSTTAATTYQYNSQQEGLHSNVARDAMGFTLGYFWDVSGAKDYIPITSGAQALYGDVTAHNATGDNLYNGNIKEMATALMKPNGSSVPLLADLQVYHYRYDQLNRIRSADAFTGAYTSAYTSLTNSNEYENTFTYDPNGNIIEQFRNGHSGAGLSMDELTYYYYDDAGSTYAITEGGPSPTNATNKLAYVDDLGTPANYADDLEAQSAGNYTYDEIGNLKVDIIEQIDDIVWTLNNKIKEIIRTGSSTKSDLYFDYDPMGNRILKIEKPRTGSGLKDQRDWVYTYYVRDAQGNVMATYKRDYQTDGSTYYSDQLNMNEWHLYGSSRLGILEPESPVVMQQVNYTYAGFTADEFTPGSETSRSGATASANDFARTLGKKMYEFANHLGNVLVTCSDKKVPVQGSPSTAVAYYMPDVRSYTDYYAFGAPLPGRQGSANTYRYGFNGKENDSETGTQDYGFRIYNPSLGKFLSVDPLAPEYPELTPYQFASNMPINSIDLDGLESQVVIHLAAGGFTNTQWGWQHKYKPVINKISVSAWSDFIGDPNQVHGSKGLGTLHVYYGMYKDKNGKWYKEKNGEWYSSADFGIWWMYYGAIMEEATKGKTLHDIAGKGDNSKIVKGNVEYQGDNHSNSATSGMTSNAKGIETEKIGYLPGAQSNAGILRQTKQTFSLLFEASANSGAGFASTSDATGFFGDMWKKEFNIPNTSTAPVKSPLGFTLKDSIDRWYDNPSGTRDSMRMPIGCDTCGGRLLMKVGNGWAKDGNGNLIK